MKIGFLVNWKYPDAARGADHLPDHGLVQNGLKKPKKVKDKMIVKKTVRGRYEMDWNQRS